MQYFKIIEVKGGQLVSGFLTAAQANSDDEAIDDDYYCFICLNGLPCPPYATCCIFIFRPDGRHPYRVAGH